MPTRIESTTLVALVISIKAAYTVATLSVGQRIATTEHLTEATGAGLTRVVSTGRRYPFPSSVSCKDASWPASN